MSTDKRVTRTGGGRRRQLTHAKRTLRRAGRALWRVPEEGEGRGGAGKGMEEGRKGGRMPSLLMKGRVLKV